ncbi:MAG: hypothetical protein RLY20_1428 [Verrucomicrobiota bacterium]|jgi:ferrous iron transport protein B
MSAPSNTPATGTTYIALTGNPNCGKTTLFNALTGLRAKVGNYAGVTVERKEGKLLAAPAGMDLRVVDLPGTYSLAPQSVDEQVSRDVLLNRLPELPAPALIVVVVDASNLQRNLYYATQVIELGRRTILALNMVDVAEANGHTIDTEALAQKLGVPVVPIVASINCGLAELRSAMVAALQKPSPAEPKTFCPLPRELETEVAALAKELATQSKLPSARARAEALLVLTNERVLAAENSGYAKSFTDAIAAARQRLDAANVDWRGAAIEARYGSVAEIQQSVTTEVAPEGELLSDKLDRILTHKIWGTLIFIAIMAVMFQCIFVFAGYPMAWLEGGVKWAGEQISGLMSPGDLRSLLVDGVIAGVGGVIVFLPQILMLFMFIGFLEDTGYMARAAFLMDRLMSKVGLHGKSFIPMLSSFACAIPGIMATRTIETPKDRLVTILVAPLMSCSARLPVYTLLIGACIPDRVLGNLSAQLNLGFTKFNLFGFLGLRGLTMLAMYLLGIIVALLMAWLFKKTLLRGETPMLILELPPYKMPVLKVILRHIWDRSKLFLTRAGTVILGINILLWFLATYPKDPRIAEQKETQLKQAAKDLLTGQFRLEDPTPEAIQSVIAKASIMGTNSELIPFFERKDQIEKKLEVELASQQLRNSFAGRAGHLIEPLIAPLGFDWKMGIGIIGSFAAREVFVSTMATVYSVEQSDADEYANMKTLVQTLRQQTRPDGTRVYSTLTGITLMVFYVFALQCVSTVAIVRRETNSWKWPAVQWLYMGTLAWTLAFATRHLGALLGLQ